jgi:hypothetical protein
MQAISSVFGFRDQIIAEGRKDQFSTRDKLSIYPWVTCHNNPSCDTDLRACVRPSQKGSLHGFPGILPVHPCYRESGHRRGGKYGSLYVWRAASLQFQNT